MAPVTGRVAALRGHSIGNLRSGRRLSLGNPADVRPADLLDSVVLDSQVQERLYVLADAPPTLPTSHRYCGTSSSICTLSSSNGPLSSSSVAGKLADHAPDHAHRSSALAARSSGAGVVERRATCGVTSGVERPAAGRSSGGRSRSGIMAAVRPAPAAGGGLHAGGWQPSAPGQEDRQAGRGGPVAAVAAGGKLPSAQSQSARARRRQARSVLTRRGFDPVDPPPVDPAAQGKTQPKRPGLSEARVVSSVSPLLRGTISLDTRVCLPGGLLSSIGVGNACLARRLLPLGEGGFRAPTQAAGGALDFALAAGPVSSGAAGFAATKLEVVAHAASGNSATRS